MVEKRSVTIFIKKQYKTKVEKIHKKFKKAIKYIRIKMEFAIFYDLQWLNMVKQIHTPTIRLKRLLISIL